MIATTIPCFARLERSSPAWWLEVEFGVLGLFAVPDLFTVLGREVVRRAVAMGTS
jgi:hypothetical protein